MHPGEVQLHKLYCQWYSAFNFCKQWNNKTNAKKGQQQLLDIFTKLAALQVPKIGVKGPLGSGKSKLISSIMAGEKQILPAGSGRLVTNVPIEVSFNESQTYHVTIIIDTKSEWLNKFRTRLLPTQTTIATQNILKDIFGENFREAINNEAIFSLPSVFSGENNYLQFYPETEEELTSNLLPYVVRRSNYKIISKALDDTDKSIPKSFLWYLVKKVIITIPKLSEFDLKYTSIIDFPGFGSSNLSNYHSELDAPTHLCYVTPSDYNRGEKTQEEINFLQKYNVKKVFFVHSKMDRIETEETDDFKDEIVSLTTDIFHDEKPTKDQFFFTSIINNCQGDIKRLGKAFKKIDVDFIKTVRNISYEIKNSVGSFVIENDRKFNVSPKVIEEAGYYKRTFFTLYDRLIDNLCTANWLELAEVAFISLRMDMEGIDCAFLVQQVGEEFSFSLNVALADILHGCICDIFYQKALPNLQTHAEKYCVKLQTRKIDIASLFSSVFLEIKNEIYGKIINEFPYSSISDDYSIERIISLIPAVFTEVTKQFLPLFYKKREELRAQFDSSIGTNSEESMSAIGKLMLLNWDNLDTKEYFSKVNSVKIQLGTTSILRSTGNFIHKNGTGLYHALIKYMTESQRNIFENYCFDKNSLAPTIEATSKDNPVFKFSTPYLPDLLMINRFLELTGIDIVIYYELSTCRFSAKNSKDHIELTYNSLGFYRNL